MKMYCVQPQITTILPKGKTVSKQVPTFYLHPNVQGIVSVEHAETIVVDICNPTHDKNIVVVPNVTAVFIE